MSSERRLAGERRGFKWRYLGYGVCRFLKCGGKSGNAERSRCKRCKGCGSCSLIVLKVKGEGWLCLTTGAYGGLLV